MWLSKNSTWQKWPDPNDPNWTNWNPTRINTRNNWSKVHPNRKWPVPHWTQPEHFVRKLFSFQKKLMDQKLTNPKSTGTETDPTPNWTRDPKLNRTEPEPNDLFAKSTKGYTQNNENSISMIYKWGSELPMPFLQMRN